MLVGGREADEDPLGRLVGERLCSSTFPKMGDSTEKEEVDSLVLKRRTAAFLEHFPFALRGIVRCGDSVNPENWGGFVVWNAIANQLLQ